MTLNLPSTTRMLLIATQFVELELHPLAASPLLFVSPLYQATRRLTASLHHQRHVNSSALALRIYVLQCAFYILHLLATFPRALSLFPTRHLTAS